jgi:hypothetical protein
MWELEQEIPLMYSAEIPAREGGVEGKLRALERKTNVSPRCWCTRKERGGQANRCLRCSSDSSYSRRGDSGMAGGWDDWAPPTTTTTTRANRGLLV